MLPRSICPEGITERMNIIPLCDDCHRGWHDGYVTLYRQILLPDERAWVEAHGDSYHLDRRYPVRASDLPF